MQPSLKIDPRITIAVIVTIILQTAGALLWAGQAAARLEAVERAVAIQPEVIGSRAWKSR